MPCRNTQPFTEKLQGFLIIEVLISAFLLTIGLVATTVLISGSLGHSLDTRDTIIAVELAQEGVELVRNVRDNNVASGGNGFAAFFTNRKNCRIDYNDPMTSLDCQNSRPASSYALQYVGGFYGHFGTGPERFSRYVYIDYTDAPTGQEKALVRSFVFWGGAAVPSPTNTTNCTAQNSCVFTEITLTNWK
ncbi:MAG: hypothetical protein A3E38_00430 [Candidatus Moranbacteria bacterium RIFCSPHIGHO2_12_FULL_54_9]|nr:MAG: hypothetical protein A2878_02290 [Candidatus Moranbacteria bacterium RIFCSPHIGHO2_01_FULL_54_31]OGI24934.1 MAG: hypothetical protein A3E38_00430 [Candidatus Moranbacteria bacterium RIFCSPHIGHO2_12_FULL_54_9]